MDEVKHPWAIRLYSGRISINELKTPKGGAFYLLTLPYYLASKLEEYIEWLMSIRPEIKTIFQTAPLHVKTPSKIPRTTTIPAVGRETTHGHRFPQPHFQPVPTHKFNL